MNRFRGRSISGRNMRQDWWRFGEVALDNLWCKNLQYLIFWTLKEHFDCTARTTGYFGCNWRIQFDTANSPFSLLVIKSTRGSTISLNDLTFTELWSSLTRNPLRTAPCDLNSSRSPWSMDSWNSRTFFLWFSITRKVTQLQSEIEVSKDNLYVNSSSALSVKQIT